MIIGYVSINYTIKTPGQDRLTNTAYQYMLQTVHVSLLFCFVFLDELYYVLSDLKLSPTGVTIIINILK